MFCQWFNPLEYPSTSSEVKSHPVHGLIHESTQYENSVSGLKSVENFSHDVGLIQCPVNGLIH